MPAKSMHSYAETLYAILDEFKPRVCFEWGPGTSTQIMALHPSVQRLDSVENEQIFYDLIERLHYDNVNFHYFREMDEYVEALKGNYDFVFIDGRDRSRCLDVAKKHSPIVMLHDAARSDYRQAIHEYQFKVWTDFGQTVSLTNNIQVYSRLKSALNTLECDEPKEEKIRIIPQAEFKGMAV
ncbi:hypothetical protein KW791_00495 [Candidatus Parcubacteria bacterium]|nr:hypothetical protein [Candidatus Parcubacteria bacterium]